MSGNAGSAALAGNPGGGGAPAGGEGGQGGQQAPQGGAPAGGERPWFETAGIDAKYAPAIAAKGWTNPNDILESYTNVEKLVSLERGGDVDRILVKPKADATPEEIAAFYAAYGADPKQFASSMQSFAVATKINRGKQFILGAFSNGDSPSTPAFIVNGKYRVKGKSVDDVFRVLNQLIVAERAKNASSAPTAAPGWGSCTATAATIP